MTARGHQEVRGHQDIRSGSTEPGTRRRAVLGAGAALAALSVVGAPGTARAASRGRASGIGRELRALERQHDAELGVFARNMATGRTVRHRAGTLFPICSVFKTLAAAAVLRDLDHDGEVLGKRLFYTAEEVGKIPHSPVTDDQVHIDHGITVAELCDATIRYSDNFAANLLLRELGGPTAITRFCRSLGDRVTRLDRWEPELNSAEPDRVTDTTTPAAIGATYARLVLGNALAGPDRARLTDWMLRNTTSGTRFRKGLPADWTLADKTGGGRYGTNNDAGVAWTPDGTPVLLVVLSTRFTEAAPAVDPLIASTAELLAKTLG
ncbi:class A beta-lactamase [Streptomyces sp. NPDC127068]|uniref:class A beta-lactamase n=1 Tax=Streptomyces sp. NPDC127068 TaxID=3347127 RepID=UPI00364AB7BB